MFAEDFDLNKPFGFCTRLSRVDATSCYEVTGGGCYTYPIPKGFSGKVVVLQSNGQDMRKDIKGTLIIISHQERILEIADEIVVVADGGIKAKGPADEMMTILMNSNGISGVCSKQEELLK